MRRLAIALLLAAAPAPKAAPVAGNRIEAQPAGGVDAPVSLSRWGVLEEIARREWTTEKEARPRVSRFRWIEEGRILEARHGFVSRLQFGDAKFADTVQRFVLDPKTGAINVTYRYEDGRPPLNTVIRIEPDGTAIETFTDANGVKKRNIHKSPRLSLNTIERQEMRETAWASLGTTRKTGLTREEIAENARRAEESRQLAIAQENARRAAEAAQRAAEEAERQAEMEMAAAEDAARNQQMRDTMNAGLMDAIRGIGTAIQERNEQRANLERLRVAAEQETARRRAEEARAEANRIAAENQRRVQEANARQAAIAAQYEAQRSANDTARAQQLAQAEADRQRRAADQQRQAEAQREREAQERQAAAEAERQRREAQAAADAEKRRQAEAARLAEQRRKEEEARRPVEFKEGVVVCEKQKERYYRCVGPLQVTYSDLVSPSGMTSLGDACGTSRTPPRDLGMASGYRIFGCNFGIHPTLRDYPGNRDVPAEYGLYISSRATFYCPRSTSAYCRGR